MEFRNRYDGLDAQAMRNVRWYARKLARERVLPGWCVEDYEQELVETLIRRGNRYDPSRSQYATFAARVIENRVCDLRREGRVRAAERRAMPLHESDGGDGPADNFSAEDGLWPPAPFDPSLNIDLHRFIGGLPRGLLRCCALLAEANVAEAARCAGLNRSTVYEARDRLRRRAFAAGLDIYVQRAPTD